MFRFVVCALALFLAAAPALAQEQLATFSGTVADAEDLGLGGVQVKVFVDGFLKGSAVSGADGSYETNFHYDEFGDQTIVAWFIPQAGLGQVPEIVVLRESEASKTMELWNPCLIRVDLSASTTFDATIYDEKTKFGVLGERECF
ncbi:MAG: hypothetical protein R3E97_21400 [Candidatus Eisenbacteria bacterium]